MRDRLMTLSPSIPAALVKAIDIGTDISEDLGIVKPDSRLVVVINSSLREVGRGHYRLPSIDHIDLSMELADEEEFSSQPSHLILDVIAHSRAAVRILSSHKYDQPS